ncbi:ATP-binding cassette domain-containing protein [Edaphobacter albus]|uniref:ATP-binding cassette domain-containing protein n=1 Tax=Edaphobacter sp. 4G125 TaxID=2763071 RepID=UPI0021082267|nr:ATP-binding cassette domain-containing protein [Edaphobacter sp. 4G125]
MSDKLPDSLLSVQMRHRVGGVALDVEFTLTTPWTVLFGPSGSGKTTILRAIAGFVRSEEGHIVHKPTASVLLDTEARVFVPAHLRPIRSAAQNAWLFPHMSVHENLLYGLPPGAKSAAQNLTSEVISLFHLSELTNRKPADLSGGERQRASVGRAVLSAVTFVGPNRPLLLLDEPFNGLDATLRDELLTGLRQWLSRWQVPVLSVTHDVGEAFLLVAEVIKIADGKVIEQGPATSVLAAERQRLLDQLRAEQ